MIPRSLLLVSLAITLLPLVALHALPVFPGAVGFGTDTPAGRGGAVYRVANLNNDGPGSLRNGLERITGPRVIIFDVSGVIRLESDLVIRDDSFGEFGYVTIAGQTAPSPGITLAGAGLSIRSHDVLVQHIAIRPGNRGSGLDNRDCIKVEGPPGCHVDHVVIDHVTCTWAVDETASTWSDQGSVSDVTFSNCIFAEPIVNGGHTKGSHPYGALGGRNTERLSLIGNLFAFNLGRNPLIRDRTGGAQVVNNFIYHPGVWSNSVIYIGDLTLPPHAVSVVGNVILRRPLPFALEQTGPDGVRQRREYQPSDYSNTAIFVHNVVSPEAGLFLHDNRVFDPQTQTWHPTDGDPWNPAIFRDSAQHPVAQLDADPYANSGGVTWEPVPAAAVEARVLRHAGKFPGRRDALDAALVDKVRSRTGNYLEDLTDHGDDPWASVDERHMLARELPADPHGDADRDGYTNLEEWLHTLAAAVESNQSSL